VSYVRIWRTRLDLDLLDEYERWVEERSKTMFREQPGFRAVLFTRSDDQIAVLSFWDDRSAVEALEDSPSYRQAVREIGETGFLLGESSVEVYRIDDFVGEGLASLTEPRPA
jgi:heme-degrading monooxygenase HmoA